MTAAASHGEHAATYRRLLRRETHVSRSGAVVIAMLITLVLAAAAVFAGALVLLDQNVLGVDPRAVVDAALAAPDGLDTTLVVGIAAIVEGARAMLELDRSAAIACDHPSVRRTLGLTGVDEVVEVYWSRDEAVSALAGGSC